MIMIETVARALADKIVNPKGRQLLMKFTGKSYQGTFADLEEYGYIALARAAIKAMHEPSEAMLNCFLACHNGDGGIEAKALWQAMVDAALEEKS